MQFPCIMITISMGKIRGGMILKGRYASETNKDYNDVRERAGLITLCHQEQSMWQL